MDRKEQATTTVKSVLHKISAKDLIGSEVNDKKLIYSVVGFIPACDYVDNSMLISNLGYLMSKRGLNTCIIDLKVFFPNLYHALDVSPNKKGNGLLKVLKSDKVDFRGEINATKEEKLFLLSPSPYDVIEEYFDFTFEHIERVISTVKDMFDIILIDIPNNPPLEFCLGTMKYCHIGFFTATERLEAAGNMVKLLDFASSVGIGTAKYTSVILMNLQDVKFDYSMLKDMGFNVVAALPFVKTAYSSTLEGKLYIRDYPLLNKQFTKEIQRLADILGDR